jgi:hypothetical protein
MGQMIKFLAGNPEGKRPFEELRAKESVILKWIVGK